MTIPDFRLLLEVAQCVAASSIVSVVDIHACIDDDGTMTTPAFFTFDVFFSLFFFLLLTFGLAQAC